MNKKEGYIPQKDRKKILLITDDIRVHSGVAQIGREMVINTAHKYNWVQLAGAIKHPEVGKRADISEDTNKRAGIEDASVFLYPVEGYGNPDILRQVIKAEKPDAIFLITDPRYFVWVFQMENEIRKKMPIIYLNIWDEYPAPMYNREYYESCDALFGISKQTANINKIVLGDKAENKIIKYVPHGLDNKNFRILKQEDPQVQEFKKRMTRGRDYDFVLLFNSRNIRRKSIPDTLLAWKLFTEKLPKDKADKCLFILHTDPVSDAGTDLPAVIDYFFPNDPNIVLSNVKLPSDEMNLLYNCADGVILLSSAEGWGLSLTEAMLTGTPFIANVTGGMQDQMRFETKDGEWIEFDENFPSNHKGSVKKCGKWAFPVFPKALSIVGSPPTPYIFDTRCTPEDAAEQIMKLYKMSPKERKKIGEEGRKWATSDEAGFTSEKMSKKIIEGIDELFETWEPRPKYEIIKDTDFESKVLKHTLL